MEEKLVPIRGLGRGARAVCVAFGAGAESLSGTTVVAGTRVWPECAAAGRAHRSRPGGGGGSRSAVFGGGRGAHRLTTAVAEGLKQLLEMPGVTVHHVCGEQDHGQLRAMRSGLDDEVRERYAVEPFSDAMPELLASADLVVARAGGSAIAEMTAVGVPMVLVPYPYAGGHQRLNAEPVERAGAAVIVPDEEFSGVRLGAAGRPPASGPSRAGTMAAASLGFRRPGPAHPVA